MNRFSITIPGQIFFGAGSRDEVEKLLTKEKGRALIVATEGTRKRSPTDKLIKMIQEKTDAVVWSALHPNPRISDVDACVQTHCKEAVSTVIGIGGGSALDQAKATAIGLSTGKSVRELLALKKPLPARNNTLILLPTTSGTGSEASYGSILSDEITGTKVGLRGKNLAADYAIVDSELSYSMPKRVSMVTGFDVVTHAIETYVSSAATPFTAVNSKEALVRACRCLPLLFIQEGKQDNMRNDMAYASMLMGINLALSTTCLPHRLQYPVGAATDTAHAEGLAALFPAWLNHVSKFATHKLAECGRWLHLADSSVPDTQAGELFIGAIVRLLKDIGLNISLRDLGIRKADLPALANAVTGRLDADPGYKDQNDILQIYKNSY